MTVLLPLNSPDEYRGQNTVIVGPRSHDPSEVRKLIGAWCRFFESGPTDILDLSIGRASQRLFDSLAAQVQLRRLRIGWGPIDDLSVLDGMANLEDLDLDSATSLNSLEPLRRHTQLLSLSIANATKLRDFSPIGDLTNLRHLALHGTADSIKFVDRLHRVNYVSWDLVPVDLDYSPLLSLVSAEYVRVGPRRGMRPSILDLEWALPGLRKRNEDEHRGISYAWRLGERIGEYRETPDGDRALFRYDIDDFE